jgi:tight adherence protein B
MQQLIPPLIYVMAFVAVVLAVQGSAGLVLTARDRRERVNRRLTMLDSGMSHDEVYAALVRRPGAANGEFGLRQIEDHVGNYLRQASLDVGARRFLAILAGTAVALWVISLVLFRTTEGSPLANSLISLVAALFMVGGAAWAYLTHRRNMRLKRIEDQLPLALDIMTRALRAGHPVISAVQLAAQELGDPLGSEFGLIVDETTYGVEFPDALGNFARRTGSKDASFFAVSISIQSQTGGNLAEILEGLANVVRSRNTLGKRVKALSSEGKASAILLSVLPFLMVGAMLLIQPAFYTSKFNDPIFWPVVAMVVLDYLIGLAMIHRIINFKY